MVTSHAAEGCTKGRSRPYGYDRGERLKVFLGDETWATLFSRF